jgi:hypothetical protein
LTRRVADIRITITANAPPTASATPSRRQYAGVRGLAGGAPGCARDALERTIAIDYQTLLGSDQLLGDLSSL